MKEFSSFPKEVINLLDSMEEELATLHFTKDQTFPYQLAIGSFAKMFERLNTMLESSQFQTLLNESKAAFRSKSEGVATKMKDATLYMNQLQEQIEKTEEGIRNFENLLSQLQQFERKKLLVTEKRDSFQSIYADIMGRKTAMEQTEEYVLEDITVLEAKELALEKCLNQWMNAYEDVIQSLTSESQLLLDECKEKEAHINRLQEELERYQEQFQELSDSEKEALSIRAIYTESNERIVSQFGETSARDIRLSIDRIKSDLEQADLFIKEQIIINEKIREQNIKNRTPGA